MAVNPIQYTSRTFNTVMADINADPLLTDKPDWWKRLVAGVMDVMSVIENASVNNNFLRTAFTRRAVADLCALIDYQPAEVQSANGNVLFDISATSVPPFSVAVADLVGLTGGSVAVPSKRFESRSVLNVVALTESILAASWNTGTSQITVANVYTTGEKIRVSTGGTMPTPFSTGTDYYAIYVDATHIRLSLTRVNAYAGTYITITGTGTGTHVLTRLSRTVFVYQQTSVARYIVGRSDGTTGWQEYRLEHKGIQKATLIVEINSVAWTQVTTFVNSVATDKHYKIIYNWDDTGTIQFGDGSHGEIPAVFDIYATYAYGGGTVSNVTVVNSVSAYAGSDTNVSGVSNPVALTGGGDAEPIEVSKKLAPLLLKTRDRFITTSDGISLAENYGGVALVEIIKNFYGTLSCKVIGVANGGGNPSAGLRLTIQQYLIDRSVLEGVDVRFQAATITAKSVTSDAKMAAGYAWSTVLPYFDLAWRLFLTEAGYEILNVYLSNGITDAVALINVVFTKTFASGDYTAIIKLLDIFTPRSFGDDIQVSDAYTFIQSGVNGIDYMTITAPTFPIALADDEITTVGTLTLTEIP